MTDQSLPLWLRTALVCATLAWFSSDAGAANFVTIGDSLTAEYDVIPEIPGFDNLPTDYAKVTVHVRLRVITIPPSGSAVRNVSHITLR